MHRIDGANPGPSDTFVEGDPQAGVPATQVTGPWLTAVQEEIAGVIEAAGLVLDKPDNGQLLAALDVFGRGSRPWRNVLTNSGFAICQRDLTYNLTAAQVQFVTDRWKCSPGTGAGAATISRTSNLPALQVVCLSKWALRLQQTAGGTVPYVEQRIEYVPTLENQAVVVSMFLELASISSGTTLTVATEFVQNFGTFGSPTVTTPGPSLVVSVGAGYTRVQGTVVLPSVAAKTISGVDDYLALRLKLPTGLTFDVKLTGVQLEAGATASPRLSLPYAIEWEGCRRFFQTSYPNSPDESGNYPPGSVALAGARRAWISGTVGYTLDGRLPTSMRIVPTVSWYSPNGSAAGNVDWEGADRAVTAQAAVGPDSTGYPSVGSARALSLLQGHYAADAEL